MSPSVPGKLIIIGAGGHAKVVADAALCVGFEIVGFVDDAVNVAPLPGWRVVGVTGDVPQLLAEILGSQVVVAIGDNRTRQEVVRALLDKSRRLSFEVPFARIIHPAATVSTYAQIEPGTVVMAGAVVNPGATVGSHAILNTSCSVDHDCVIGSFAHLSPGVHLSGTVTVEEGAHLGVGVSVLPSCRIGRWSVVGAGAAAVDDVPENTVAFGVPAKAVRRTAQ